MLSCRPMRSSCAVGCAVDVGCRAALSSCVGHPMRTSGADRSCRHAARASCPWHFPTNKRVFSFASVCLSIGAAQLTRRVESAWGGSRERGSCLLTSPPPQGGWARRYSSRTPAQLARATLARRAARAARAAQAATRGGARGRRSEASGGSVRLAAASGGVNAFVRSGACLVPYSGRSRAPPVGGSAPLVVHFRSAQQGCTQNRPLGRRRRRTAKTDGEDEWHT
jgi:hypothetical protein